MDINQKEAFMNRSNKEIAATQFPDDRFIWQAAAFYTDSPHYDSRSRDECAASDLKAWIFHLEADHGEWRGDSEPRKRRYGEMALVLYDFTVEVPRICILPFFVDIGQLHRGQYFMYANPAQIKYLGGNDREPNRYLITIGLEFWDDYDRDHHNSDTWTRSFTYDADAQKLSLSLCSMTS